MDQTKILAEVYDKLVELKDYYTYIRNDNLDIGNKYDYTHGIFQGRVESAELMCTIVLKILESLEEDL